MFIYNIWDILSVIVYGSIAIVMFFIWLRWVVTKRRKQWLYERQLKKTHNCRKHEFKLVNVTSYGNLGNYRCQICGYEIKD
jgi:hypothetical protein